MDRMKPIIKIFVSHRVDQQNEIIQDEVFTPVRCGAILDHRNTELQQGIIGDNTGDNISEKRYRFNEMTVLYWAWKNVTADYYGVCHYRRYFSYNLSQKFPINEFQLVEDTTISDRTRKKYCLYGNAIQDMIEKYPDVDAFLPTMFDISIINKNKKYTHYKRYEDNIGKIASQLYIKELYAVVEELCPEYLPLTKEYYKGNKAYFCDTFIMKKDLYNEYCEWIFKIMFTLEKRIDYQMLSMNATRIIAFFSEDLLSIFMLKKIHENAINIKELQLVYFTNPSLRFPLRPKFKDCKNAIIMSVNDPYVPYASVMIKSIINNSSSGNKYDLIILQTDISNRNKILLQSMTENLSNFSIRFVDVSEEIYGYEFDTSAYGLPAFYRLVIPYVLNDYHRILYFDADMVVNRDVAELYTWDLEGNILGAVPDIRAASWYNNEGSFLINYIDNELKINVRKNKYFNSGVLIIDIKQYKNAYTVNEVLTAATERKLTFPDQDALNVLFEGKVKYLPLTWNTMVSGDNMMTEKYAPLDMYNEYLEARSNPAIVHYAGNFTPVIIPEGDFYWYFWKYAKQSPFYEVLLAKMAFNHSDYLASKLGYSFENETTKLKLIRKIIPKNIRAKIIATMPEGTIRRQLLNKIYVSFFIK